jgi:8-oxo-dGTP pyrophosphatase MutT (NUDIX family)
VKERFRKRNSVLNEFSEAAVAIILSEESGELKTLLVKRASASDDPWSGHMAFPGGRRSPLDKSIMRTVVRETFEETGVELLKCDFIGMLDPLSSVVIPNMRVLPFIFACHSKPTITLNEELIAHFWVPLNALKKTKAEADIVGNAFPSYEIMGEVVWGLTFRILEGFFSLFSTYIRNHDIAAKS